MVAVEHLPFGFGEKVCFVNYCQNALNPTMQRVPRPTLTRTLYSIYRKEKKKQIEITFLSILRLHFRICRYMERQFW